MTLYASVAKITASDNVIAEQFFEGQATEKLLLDELMEMDTGQSEFQFEDIPDEYDEILRAGYYFIGIDKDRRLVALYEKDILSNL